MNMKQARTMYNNEFRKTLHTPEEEVSSVFVAGAPGFRTWARESFKGKGVAIGKLSKIVG